MNQPSPQNVWLEVFGSPQIPIAAGCSIGRSTQNLVVLKDSKASRRHALIHPQAENEYWLVDFGSTNGTAINGRRVVKPTLLRDRDQIFIGDETFTFRQGAATAARAETPSTTGPTVRDVKTVRCWLLVADIESSTRLHLTVPADELRVLFGRWFAECKETIDAHNGQIHQFLGDGFFAYWDDSPASAAQVAGAVQKLTAAQNPAQLKFRWVLHHGSVSVGATAFMGEDRLIGPEIHFTFRMEALAGQLHLNRLLSEPARASLPCAATFSDAGMHALAGFDGPHHFYTF